MAFSSFIDCSMSNSGKKTPSSPKKGLGSVPERSENDDISTSSGDRSLNLRKSFLILRENL